MRRKDVDDRVTIINQYALRDRGAFVAAVTALAARVRVEGHTGVLSYRFYAPEGTGMQLAEGRAVVIYANPAALAPQPGPAAWVGHHDTAMGWPEMANLRAAAELVEIAIHGPLSDAMANWLDRSGLAPRCVHHGLSVVGFERP